MLPTANTLPPLLLPHLGIGRSNSIHYLAICTLCTPQTDSSGFALHYTASLRPYDMGILSLGASGLTVPGGIAFNSTPNVCPESCTRSFGTKLTLVSNFFRMNGVSSARCGIVTGRAATYYHRSSMSSMEQGSGACELDGNVTITMVHGGLSVKQYGHVRYIVVLLCCIQS